MKALAFPPWGSERYYALERDSLGLDQVEVEEVEVWCPDLAWVAVEAFCPLANLIQGSPAFPSLLPHDCFGDSSSNTRCHGYERS